MKIKTLKFYVLLALAVVFGMTACQDDFSEEDFLNQLAQQGESKAAADHERRLEEIRLQAQLAASNDSALAVLQSMLSKELAMLNEELNRETDSINAARQKEELRTSGLLLDYSVQMQDGGTPLADVVVRITDFGDGAAARQASDTTDANGVVTFVDIPIGYHTLNFSATGYVSAGITVNFNWDLWNRSFGAGGITVFAPRVESSVFPMVSDGTGGSNTATVSGQVKIDSDLINNEMSEYAAGIEIKALLDDFFDQGDIVPPANGSAFNYRFENSGTFGMAVTDSLGNYSMTVPARADGDGDIELFLPTFERAQILGWLDDDDMPHLDTVNSIFGPDYGDAPDYVPGAWAEFPDPPSAGGAGFTLSLTEVGTNIGDDDFGGWTSPENPTNPFQRERFDADDSTFYNFWMQLTSRGSGYTSSPDIAISGGGGSGAMMGASLRGFFTSITSDGGSGYTEGEDVDVTVWYRGVYPNDGGDGDTTLIEIVTFNDLFEVPAGGELPATITLPTSGEGISYPFETENESTFYGYHVIGDSVTFSTGTAPTTDANGDVVFDAEVNNLKMFFGGDGYTSAPTFTFSGGGGSSQAALTMSKFKSFYFVDVDNSGVTEDYTRVPDIDIFYQSPAAISGTAYTDYTTVLSTPSVWFGDPVDNGAGLENVIGSSTDVIEDMLTVSGGQVVWINPTNTVVTIWQSETMPTVQVVDPVSVPAFALVDLDGDGTLDGTPFYNIERGEGYDAPFGVTIVPTFPGLPGSGAVVELIGTEGSWEWTDEEVVNEGSGYRVDANWYEETNFEGDRWIFNLKPGDAYIRDFHYGTGDIIDGENYFGS